MMPNRNPQSEEDTVQGQPEGEGAAPPLAIIGRIGDVLGVIGLLGIVLGVFLTVLARNMFEVGLVWADDLVRYFQVWMVFCAAVGLTLRGDHITMEALYQRLAPRFQRGLSVAHGLASVGVCALMTWLAWQSVTSAWRIGQRSWSGSWPAVYGLSAPAVGFALMAVASLAFVWSRVRSTKEK